METTAKIIAATNTVSCRKKVTTFFNTAFIARNYNTADI